VHRLVVDESHLLDERSWKPKFSQICSVPAHNVWCVTGTPFSAGVIDLRSQSMLLGQYQYGHRMRKFMSEAIRDRSGIVLGDQNKEVVDALRTIMIRHTKSQRIGGEVALALPDADCQTVWLEMSADEKLLYVGGPFDRAARRGGLSGSARLTDCFDTCQVPQHHLPNLAGTMRTRASTASLPGPSPTRSQLASIPSR
jgi:hypothetical protein